MNDCGIINLSLYGNVIPTLCKYVLPLGIKKEGSLLLHTDIVVGLHQVWGPSIERGWMNNSLAFVQLIDCQDGGQGENSYHLVSCFVQLYMGMSMSLSFS